MSAAEDRTEKSVVTPGWLLPARELYGAMLLMQGVPKEALTAFEATLAKEPNRFNAIAGAAIAAKALGDNGRAKGYYQRLAGLTTGGNVDRPEFAAAREFLAKN